MSRKKQVYEKITALYCRISLDDGGDNESMSISNQKLMLRDFAEKHGMFQYEYYVDDGYTGRNFNRPSFQRMIADIEAGKIGCVITKDLSRLGRNYIEAGSYIEIFFPKHNVRYIAITDGVDSLTRQEMDITPFTPLSVPFPDAPAIPQSVRRSDARSAAQRLLAWFCPQKTHEPLQTGLFYSASCFSP